MTQSAEREPKSKSATHGYDDAMHDAKAALKRGDGFKAVALASKAVRDARARRAYTSVAALLPVLRDARAAVRDQAIKAKKIYRIDAWTEGDEPEPEPGLWLVEPPAVGADGRALRDRALELGIPVFVLVREPETRDGRWPVVMVGPATTRAKVEPPKDDTPTVAWMVEALEALTASALGSVDGSAAETRVNQLFDRMETIPDALAIYDELANACVEAAAAHADAESRRRPVKDN